MDYFGFIDFTANCINLLGIFAMVLGILFTIVRFLADFVKTRKITLTYQALRQNLGRTIIIGLELLIVADIIRSIAVPPNFTTVGVLAIIVFIRAFLSIQIEHGTEWNLPWNHREK